MERTQRQKGLNPFQAGLADTNQNAGGEGHPYFSSRSDGLESHVGALVGGPVMDPAGLAETI